MGIRKNLVFIEGIPKCSKLELITSLGFEHITFHEQASLGTYIAPPVGFIAVAHWNNFTVIAHDTLPMSMIESDFVRRRYFQEVTIRRFFNSKNTLAVCLESNTNFYGMALRKGNTESGVYGKSGSRPHAWGERTAIEADYLANSYLNEQRDRIYTIDGKELTHDQLGENIILWNIESFTGAPAGEVYELTAEVFKVNDEHLYYDS